MTIYNKKKKCFAYCPGSPISPWCTSNWRHCKFVRETESEFERNLHSLIKIPKII